MEEAVYESPVIDFRSAELSILTDFDSRSAELS